jgi:hypothetical protein
LVIENEEKHSRLLEKKNEENIKSYAELLKGKNHGQPKSKKTIEDKSSRKPSMFRPQINLTLGPLTCYFPQAITMLLFLKTLFLKMYAPCTIISLMCTLVAPLQPAYVC